MSKVKLPKASNGRVNRHKITFRITRGTSTFKTADVDVRALALARLGQSTQSIQNQTGLTKGQVGYRVKKGGATGLRAAFRNGETPEAKMAVRACSKYVIEEISREVSPKFL